MFDYEETDAQKAPRRRPMTQSEKNRALGALMVVEFAKKRACTIDALKVLAKEAGLSGRIELQLGPGVGGQGGMDLFHTKEQVTANRDNLVRLIRDFVGKEETAQLLAAEGIEAGDFEAWVNSLLRAEAA